MELKADFHCHQCIDFVLMNILYFKEKNIFKKKYLFPYSNNDVENDERGELIYIYI